MRPRDLNSMYFSEERVKSGELNKFLNMLLEQCYGKGGNYNDIHIFPADIGAFIVEWVQIPWSHEWGGKFDYIDQDESVYVSYELPDHTFVDLPRELPFEEYLEDWLVDNPGWVRTSYGTWTNEIENAEFQRSVEKDFNAGITSTSGDDEYSENGIPQF